MPATRLVVKAQKDERRSWAWKGGYISAGTHMGRPYYKRDTSAGGKQYYIFYHRHFDSWFIATRVHHGNDFSYNVESAPGAPNSPEKARWPKDDVQEVIDRSDADVSGPSASDPSLFVDGSFPHSTSASINRSGLKQVKLEHGHPQWIPGRRLREGRWKLFDGIDPRDLLQGNIGNCWLIAAISAMAEFPEEIERLFLRDGLKKGDGRYVVSIFNHKTNVIEEVTVDEYIPCKPGRWWDTEAEPYFAQPNGNELWCLILEKAMAKVWGSYGELRGGCPSAAFRALTGHKKQILWEVDDSKASWKKSTLADGKTSAFTWPGSGKESLSRSDFFKHLHECDQENFLMAASIDGGREEKRSDGLVEGHSYTLISVAALTAEDGTRFRLVQLRNPWGDEDEWNGNWSDGHSLWKRYPEVKRSLRPTFGDDGAFWMDFENFARIFTEVCISHKSMRKGTFQPRDRPAVQKFVEGQVVQVFSRSTSSWVMDGKIVQVLDRSEMVDGAVSPAGSVKVEYHGGKSWKWVEPDHFSKQLKALPATAGRAGATAGGYPAPRR